MKKTLLEITEMPEALAAYNSALQRAMLVMRQKNVYEATAAITVKIEIDPLSDRPKVTYKTSVRVPIEITDKGTAVKASQIYWDEDMRSFVMEIDGEQIRMEGFETPGKSPENGD